MKADDRPAPGNIWPQGDPCPCCGHARATINHALDQAWRRHWKIIGRFFHSWQALYDWILEQPPETRELLTDVIMVKNRFAAALPKS